MKGKDFEMIENYEFDLDVVNYGENIFVVGNCKFTFADGDMEMALSKGIGSRWEHQDYWSSDFDTEFARLWRCIENKAQLKLFTNVMRRVLVHCKKNSLEYPTIFGHLWDMEKDDISEHMLVECEGGADWSLGPLSDKRIAYHLLHNIWPRIITDFNFGWGAIASYHLPFTTGNWLYIKHLEARYESVGGGEDPLGFLMAGPYPLYIRKGD
jgi:hypothetical protein